MTKKVITFGVFDLLHAGHINLIKEMTRFGEYIIIAVQKDEFAKQMKRETTYPIKARIELLESILIATRNAFLYDLSAARAAVISP